MQKRYRLTKRNDFQGVYRVKQSSANHQFVIFYRKNKQVEHFRLGVSVSKKMGKAVVRNRLRRTIKEIVRLHKEEVMHGVDFIVITRKGTEMMDYAQLEKSLIHAMKRAKLIDSKRTEPSSGSRARISKLN